jgi:4'-phosphopantetheinyl transferase
LWLADGREVLDQDFAFFVQQLGASEADRYARFSRPERQRQFVLGRMLLRLVTGHLTGVSPAAIKVDERSGSAPLLFFPDSISAPPLFSLSHSGDWIACAASLDSALGIDIERIDSERDVLTSSQAAFHVHEHAWILAQPEDKRHAAFYRLWSLREALYKLLSGTGAQMPPVLAEPARGMARQGQGWHGYTLPYPGMSLVVCSAQELEEVPVPQAVSLTRASWLAISS